MNQYLKTTYNLDSKELIEVIDELPYWSAPFGVVLLENIRYKKGIKALDIGFGAGFPLTEIAMRLGNSCKVYGIDPWESAIERTKKKIKVYSIDNIEIIQGYAENIPLENKSLDLITSNNGINNVKDLDKVLSECSRLLKKDGQFIQTINLNSTMMEFYELLEETLLEFNLGDCIPAIKKHIHEKRKPLHEFTDLLLNHQFRPTQISNHQFEYTFADGSALFNHYFIRLAFLDSWKNLVPEAMQNKVFSEIENKMNQIAKENGCFKLRVPFVMIDCTKEQ